MRQQDALAALWAAVKNNLVSLVILYCRTYRQFKALNERKESGLFGTVFRRSLTSNEQRKLGSIIVLSITINELVAGGESRWELGFLGVLGDFLSLRLRHLPPFFRWRCPFLLISAFTHTLPWPLGASETTLLASGCGL